jgi:hypothetical protein
MINRLATFMVFLVATSGLLLVFFSRSHMVSLGVVENIDGISFPLENEQPLITEKLAHVDVPLQSSRFARQLRLSISFSPLAIEDLAVGIRENSFWLSYDKHNICCSAAELAVPTATITKMITIPVTDKLADHDRSLDLMFFASRSDGQTGEDEGMHDRTLWQLRNLTVVNEPAWPDLPAIRDYIKSAIYQEQAL